MNHVEKVLRNSGMTLEETLSLKENHAVLRVQRADTGSFILRLYRKEIPAYIMLEKEWCKGFPPVYRTYEEEGFFVVEEELVEGISLQSYLSAQGTLNEAETKKLTQQVCEVLKELHSRGVIHRDIKPEHILLTEDKQLYIIDLDGTMMIQPEKEQDTQLIGTVVYAAPEQFGLARSDQRADVYAIGILMNEMLTGVHPAVTRYQDGPLADVIERCIRMNPAERYQTAEELSQVLDAIEVRSSAVSEKKKTGKKKLLAGICAAAVLLAVIAVIFLPGNSAELPEEEPPGQTLTVDGVEYLQLYKGERRLTTYRNFRLGYQFDKLFTEDGTQVDESWNVYTDSQVGFINGWEESFGGWRVQSEGCDIDARGYLYAEKDGKQYAIEVIVLGEPMSAYVSVPELGNLTEGYLQPEHHPSIHEREVIRLTYRKNEPVILYLAAMEGASNLEMPVCSSALIHIEPFDGADAWDKPVFTMTYENPDGGDALVEVKSNVGHLIFYFEEE